MYDNYASPIGTQIRTLRRARGLTLAELARRAGTSAPSVHRYESGWDRFRVATLRRIARALGARLEIQMLPRELPREPRPRPAAGGTAAGLAKLVAPLFWDRRIAASDLESYPDWVLRRVLTFGNAAQVAAARRFYGDDAIRKAVVHRSVDHRTRNYWQTVLGER